MEKKIFLSIDWDYFIKVHTVRSHSYREVMKDILDKWYRDYLLARGNNCRLEDDFELGDNYKKFKQQELSSLNFAKPCKMVLTESHADAYEEVMHSKADTLYLLDAHSDLGYGGLISLDYEVNCANWVGKLLKIGKLKQVYIVYSPYTKEYSQEFKAITDCYHIKFISLQEMLEQQLTFSYLHMCRSGPWTPPWYDKEFYLLAYSFKVPVEDHVKGMREWHPRELSLADRINYRLGIG